jgi:hypothetical protein
VGKQLKHIHDPDTHAPNARATTALLRIYSDAILIVHGIESKFGWPLQQAAICAFRKFG